MLRIEGGCRNLEQVYNNEVHLDIILFLLQNLEIHIGRNISRLRELRGIKQEALAFAIGVSHQTISNIENSETVEDDKLQLIAKELGMTSEAIKNFTEENVINFFNKFLRQ